MSRGLLFIVAAPSGAGKSSLIEALLKDDPRLKLADCALELKLLVEQVREQVQNIE